MMLVALTFTACGEEINIDGPKTTDRTEFFTNDETTRTTIDKDRFFYWTIGDKIFIDNGSQWVMSTESDITDKTAKAKFEVPGAFTATSYPVRFTGYTGNDTTATSATTVTIADQQTQSAWSNGDHIAQSGDCGHGTAYKQPNGKYKFQIEHQASYLMFYPYLSSKFSGNYTLQSITIMSDLSASTIAGTYNFGTNGLLDANNMPLTPQAGTGKQQITLTCDGGFGLRQTVPDLTSTNTFNHCIVVVAPGEHQLTINYTVTDNNTGNTFEFIQDVPLTNYVPNGVYPFIYEFTPNNMAVDFGLVFDEDTYYPWGYTTSISTSNAPSSSEYGTTGLRSVGTVSDDFWADIPASLWRYFALAERPYIYWDNNIKWTLNRQNGRQTTKRGGLWVRKKQYNLGWINNVSSRVRFVPTLGRPSETEWSKYFFLPALGTFGNATAGSVTQYWGSSRYGSTILCDAVSISSTGGVLPEYLGDYTGRIAGRRPATGNVDGSSNTNWWQ